MPERSEFPALGIFDAVGTLAVVTVVNLPFDVVTRKAALNQVLGSPDWKQPTKVFVLELPLESMTLIALHDWVPPQVDEKPRGPTLVFPTQAVGVTHCLLALQQ